MKVLALFAVSLVLHASGLKIECFFDNELLFDELKVSYSCTALRLQTNATKRKISEVSGEHIDRDHTNINITQLYIINQEMEYFPQGFTKFFGNIVAIHAGRNKLKHLERNDLTEFKKIRYLYLYHNLLEVLSSDLFQDNVALEYISFYGNRLKNIGSKILLPLKSLRTAYFNKNICIDKQAVASEQRGIAELRIEIEQQCSDITDEDLMNVLKLNHMKISKLESKVAQLGEQLTSIFELLTIIKAKIDLDNTTDNIIIDNITDRE